MDKKNRKIVPSETIVKEDSLFRDSPLYQPKEQQVQQQQVQNQQVQQQQIQQQQHQIQQQQQQQQIQQQQVGKHGVVKVVPLESTVKNDNTLIDSSPAFKEQNNKEPKKKTKKKRKSVNMFLEEQIYILVDTFQIYGLFWLAFRQWQLPKAWLQISEFTNLFNGDVWSIVNFHMDRQSKVTDYINGNYIILALICIGAVPVGLILLHGILNRQSVFNKNMEYVALRVVDFSFVPFLLLSFRALTCYFSEKEMLQYISKNDLIGIEPVYQCGSMVSILLAFLFVLPVCIFYLVILQKVQYKLVDSIVISKDSQKFEDFLIQKEIEWSLGLENEWLVDHFRLLSSFNRDGAYYRFKMQVRKLFIVTFLFVFQGVPWFQGQLLFYFSLIWVVKTMVKPPFRSKHSNRLVVVLEWILVINLYLGSLKASQVQSPLASSSGLFYSMTFFNGFAFIYLVIIHPLLIVIFDGRASDGKFSPIQNVWTVNDRLVHNLESKGRVVKWILTMKEMKHFIRVNHFTPNIIYPIHHMIEKIKALKSCYDEAISDKEISLSCTINQVLEQAYGVFDAKVEQSMFPNPYFQSSITPQFAKLVKKRQKEMILMNPMKKRLLLKLTALSKWGLLKKFIMPESIQKEEADAIIRKINAYLKQYNVSNYDRDHLDLLRRQLRGIPNQDEQVLACIKQVDRAIAQSFQRLRRTAKVST